TCLDRHASAARFLAREELAIKLDDTQSVTKHLCRCIRACGTRTYDGCVEYSRHACAFAVCSRNERAVPRMNYVRTNLGRKGAPVGITAPPSHTAAGVYDAGMRSCHVKDREDRL